MAVRDVVQAAAGVGGEDNLYVEDVFSTYLYTGNGSTQTITNGIDLDSEGGLVWLKDRLSASLGFHTIYDTEGGTGPDGGRIFAGTAGTNARSTQADGLQSFNSTGFTLGANTYENGSGKSFASWTFRKAPKFFDVLVHTADTSVVMNHDLGVVPGCIIVKNTNVADYWGFFHRGTNGYMLLNTTEAADGVSQPGIGSSTSTSLIGATSTTIDFSNWYNPNTNFVVYLFAHDAGGFGLSGEDNVVSCGSFTGASDVNLGYEPQWILLKRSDGVNDWWIFDTMRGWLAGSDTASVLKPNLSNAELSTGFDTKITSTGFTTALTGTFIYIAIRRPMKTPESGTEVFTPDLANAAVAPLWEAPFPVDLGMYAKRDSSTATFYAGTRLTGTGRLSTWDTAAEVTDNSFKWDYMNGWFNNAFTDSQYLGYSFRRAPGFMDVVCWTGNGINPTAINHNLSVSPELIITKSRSNTTNWITGFDFTPTTYRLGYLNDSASAPSTTYASSPVYGGEPTASTFVVGNQGGINLSTYTYVSYLFATLPGISKVGTYTGTGADINVDCGFSAGARFVLIKRTDDTGDWYVWDSARGIVAGNDPYLRLNSTAAEVTSTDYIDPLSSGFTVTSSAPAALNASGGSYIFLAIA
jgi:hypothetical protein